MKKDLRTFMDECEKKLPKEFVRVTRKVDPKYEIGAIIKKLDLMGKYPMVLFENVKGYSTPVVCNTETSFTKFGLALGCAPDQVENYYIEKEEEAITQNRFPAKEVRKNEAPCKEVILTGKKADMTSLPFIIHHEGEAPYLTRAIGVVMDKKTNSPHCAHYRFMVKKPQLGVTHITPGRHFWYIYNQYMERNEPLPIAFVVGLHPAWATASQSRVPHPPSEYDVAGALLGEPLEVVRCETSDILVPARAEIILEGEIPPGVREEEGPWGDFTKYHQVAMRHPVKIKAITYRKNPIVHDMGAWPSKGMIMGRIPQHAYMNRKLKEAVPDVKKFRFVAAAGWWYGFIQLDKKHAGQPKQAILAAFANDLYLKYVVCFDSDIDIENGQQMTWALATRVQADRDIMVLPGVLGTDLDLSAAQEAVVTKVGVDATAKPFRKDYPPVASIPESVMKRIDLKDFIPKFEEYV
ncbi:MAG: UbiD family decarboxylase [Deltaproteobacteria bacterium]|jgi:2,5-furandicarboxylate decarboxylase 1|nr:UbiD family decarboxylase [Deltaproteobacteria bacterium]